MFLRAKSSRHIASTLLLLISLTSISFATNYYVATTGNNTTNNGTSTSTPFQTIQKAADVMQPGDTCYVRAGTYREYINPPRGGSSETARIVYKAYPGERPVVKGSERISTWTNVSGTVYKVDIADATMFSTFNPYTMTMSQSVTNGAESWLYYGHNMLCGGVFLNGKPFREKLVQNYLTDTTESWYATHNGATTTIYANFGKTISNSDLVEVTARKCVFSPSTSGLKFITIDGFTMQHAATGWGPPESIQTGLVNTNAGYRWVIQNNIITDSRCIGICSGFSTTSINLGILGSHLIQYNTIQRCGEAAIAGSRGLGNSIIRGNLIEDINFLQEFGGEEQAGIKMHYSLDLTIEGNIIRRVYEPQFRQSGSSFGIWVDWQNQGTRLSRNIIYDCGCKIVSLEMNHGPQLVDNNIFMGRPFDQHSEATVMVNNLFYRSAMFYCGTNDTRQSGSWTPKHSTGTISRSGNSVCRNKNFRYYNNMYIYELGYDNGISERLGQGGNDPVNCIYDYNIYYRARIPTTIPEGTHSVTDAVFQPNFGYQTLTNGIRIGFEMNTTPQTMQCPLISSSFLGSSYTNATPGNEGIEDINGNPITVNTDIKGNTRGPNPIAGPFDPIQASNNEHIFLAGADRASAGPPINYDEHWNLAMGATASATSGTASYLNDYSYNGKRECCSANDAYTSTSTTIPQYMTLTWRYGQNFNQVVIKTNGANQAPSNYDVQVSDDGSTNWTTVAAFTGTPKITDPNGWGNSLQISTFTQVTNKKGVRLKINATPVGSIGEFEVYNTINSGLPTPSVKVPMQSAWHIQNHASSDRIDIYDMKGRCIVRNQQIHSIQSVMNKNVISGQGAYVIVHKAGSQKIVEKIVISR